MARFTPLAVFETLGRHGTLIPCPAPICIAYRAPVPKFD